MQTPPSSASRLSSPAPQNPPHPFQQLLTPTTVSPEDRDSPTTSPSASMGTKSLVRNNAPTRQPQTNESRLTVLSTISDLEHPLSLFQLAVIQLPYITVENDPSYPVTSVLVEITPTIPHCSRATRIGLWIRVRLE